MNKHTRRGYWGATILVVLGVLPAACRAAPEPTLSPADTSTPTPAWTATPSPQPTSTSTLWPTPFPTRTPTPQPRPSPTPCPTSPAQVDELPAPPLSLAVSPSDQLVAYALLANDTLYQTSDTGERWRKVPLPVPERAPAADPSRPNALSILSQRDLKITAVWPHNVLLRVGGVLYRREGESSEIGREAAWEPLLDGVVVWDCEAGEGQWIYAWRQGQRTEADPGGKTTHGLYRSKDGGASWKQVYAGFFPPSLQGQDVPGEHEGMTALLIDSSVDQLYAAADDGLYRSLNGGRTWARFEVGLSEAARGRRTPLLINGPWGAVYALTTLSPAVDGREAQAILVRLEHGTYIPDEDRWAVVGGDELSMLSGAGSGFWGVHTLAVDPALPDLLYLGTEQGLWQSRDGGETWLPVNLGGGPEARPVGAVYRIAVQPGEQSELYFWSDTGLHVRTLDTPTILSQAISNEVRFEVAGQVGGQSRAVAVGSDVIYLGIGPRLATLRSAALTDVAFSPPLPGVIEDLAVDEEAQIAVIAAGEVGLLIVDISSLPSARLLGAVETAYPAQAVAVRDGLAVVAEGQWGGRGGVSLVDVSLPDMPWLVARRRLPGPAHGVALSGEYAYLACENGLVVLDLSKPEEPIETSRISMPSIYDVTIQDGYAYLAADGLQVYDLSDPARPKPVARASTIYGSFSVSAHEDRAYIADVFCEMGGCGSTLRIYDIGDPTAPQEVGSWLSHSAVQDLAVWNRVVYLASWQKGVEALDVRDPALPSLLDTYGTLGEVVDVVIARDAAEGEWAYVSDGAESGLQVLDLSFSPGGRVWPTPRVAAELRWANGYVVQDGLAYVPMWSSGLSIVDVRDPDAPRKVWSQDIGQAAQAVVVQDVAYVSTYDGLVVLDVSDPAAPQRLSRLALDGPAVGLAAGEGVAYVAVEQIEGDDEGTLYTIDVRDLRAPQVLGAVGLPGRGLRVAQAGEVVYVAVFNWPSWSPWGGLQVVDVSQPADPQLGAFLHLPDGALDVQVSGATAFVAGREAGVYAADLSDPTDLRLTGHFDTPGQAQRVFVWEERLYVADGAGGLIVLQVERKTN